MVCFNQNLLEFMSSFIYSFYQASGQEKRWSAELMNSDKSGSAEAQMGPAEQILLI